MAHIANLNFLSDYFLTTYLCDISEQALAHCAKKVAGTVPHTTTKAEQLCASPDVDVVLVCNATAFHPEHAILALRNNKYVLVEKPLALCYKDIDAIAEAEKQSKGKVFVGYMRRYAAAFLDAIAEIGGRDQIQYARVRDLIGPNSVFVSQSGTFPKRFTDYRKEDSDGLLVKEKDMVETMLRDCNIKITEDTKNMLGLLGSLGSHDLSAMREILGIPKNVLGASLALPIWSALFQYDPFPVVYESGIIDVPAFDAHIEVYSNDKIVRINYDTPYVKGLPITMTVREKTTGPRGESTYQERVVRTTYEDAYTLEFKDFYHCVVNGKTPKTTVADAREDLDIFKMLLQAGYGTT